MSHAITEMSIDKVVGRLTLLGFGNPLSTAQKQQNDRILPYELPLKGKPSSRKMPVGP